MTEIELQATLAGYNETELQLALMRYLASIKAEAGEAMLICLELETKNQMIELLKYIYKNSPKEIETLYEIACEIAGREGLLN